MFWWLGEKLIIFKVIWFVFKILLVNRLIGVDNVNLKLISGKKILKINFVIGLFFNIFY